MPGEGGRVFSTSSQDDEMSPDRSLHPADARRPARLQFTRSSATARKTGRQQPRVAARLVVSKTSI